MTKIKWSWKLRIKRNSNRILSLEAFVKEQKIYQSELERDSKMRDEGLEHWISEIARIRKIVEEAKQL